MRRRKYLASLGVATSLGLAGCGGGTNGGNNTSGGNGSGGTETGGSAGDGSATETPADTQTTAAGGAGGQATTAAGMADTPVVTTVREPSPMTTTAGPAGTTMAAETPMATETVMATATTGGGSSESSSGAASIESSEFAKQTEFGVASAAMVGEVTAASRLQSLELRATFRNDAGDVLTTSPGFFQGLEQGQTWAFYIPMLADAAAATSGEVTVAEAITGPAPPQPNAKVVESSLNPPADEFTGPTVTGRAENTGSSTLPYLEARVKFLAGDGTALDSDYTNIIDLPAGETWSFEIEQIVFSADKRPDAADYEITLAA